MALRPFMIAFIGFRQDMGIHCDDGVQLILIQRDAVRYSTTKPCEVIRPLSMAARISRNPDLDHAQWRRGVEPAEYRAFELCVLTVRRAAGLAWAQSQ